MTSSASAEGTGIAAEPANEQEQPDRRTRHRNRRRDQVYAAAIDLFIERGFDNATMDDIAERADVARATVFNYFTRKTTFLEEWTTRRRQRAAVAAREKALANTSLSKILERYVMEMARLSEGNRDETVALMDACLLNTNLLAHPALGHELAGFIRDAQVAGDVASEVNPEQAGVLIAISYFAVLAQWIEHTPAPFDLEKELLSMLDLVMYGIFN